MQTVNDFEIDQKVIYIPYEGCSPTEREEGIVTKKTDRFVFVRYGNDIISKATNPTDLLHITIGSTEN